MHEKTRSVNDLVGLLKRDGAEPVPVEQMRIGRDPEPLDPVPLAEALRDMRRRAVICYQTSPSGPVYSVHATAQRLGVLTDAATLIEQQAAEVERLRAALFEVDRLLPHWDEIDPAREAITAALEGGAA